MIKPNPPHWGASVPWMVLLEIIAFIVTLVLKGKSEASSVEEISKKFNISRTQARKLYRNQIR